ncbi:MAG: LysR family transcriptional regulator [Gammaproteobacteria bacterium]|nr:LysR family transcriptional regulator [Gammaproteobacteria bacterium]
MDLGALIAFVRVVDSGSFTKAAAALKTHKAQLSRTLANLERELGVRLLERTTRRLRLTDIGQEIYQRSVSVLAGVEDIAATAATQSAGPRGVLRLATDPEFGLVGLGRWTNAYAERYPDVRVEVDLSGRMIDLVHDGFDLAIHLGPAQERDIAPVKVGELSYGLFASPAYLERHGAPEDPDQIAGHSLLMFASRGQRNLWRLITLSRELRVERPARIQANNSVMVRDAALRGLGLALLPTSLVKDEVSRGALKRVLSAWSGPRVPVHAAFPSERPASTKVRAFVELASQTALG